MQRAKEAVAMTTIPGSLRIALEWAAIVVVLVALYPVIGWLDQWFGWWWVLTILAVPLLVFVNPAWAWLQRGKP
jgi:hypothetical protein